MRIEKMLVKYKTLMLLGIFVILCLISGCKKNQTKTKNIQPTLKETQLKLPEEANSLTQLMQMKDGKLRLVAFTKGNDQIVWTSPDSGITYVEPLNPKEVLGIDEEGRCNVYLDMSGNIVCDTGSGQAQESSKDYRINYSVIKADGTINQYTVNLPEVNTNKKEEPDDSWSQNGILQLTSVDEERICIQDYTGRVFLIEEFSGKILMEYKTANSTPLVSITVHQGNLYMLADDGSTFYYELETGENIKKDNFKTSFAKILERSENQFKTRHTDVHGEKFYIGAASGVYEYDGKTGIHQKFGTIKSLMGRQKVLDKFIVSDNAFFMSLWEAAEGAETYKFFKLEVPEDDEEKKALSVFAMTENEADVIRSIIPEFSRKYPDVEVIMKSGIAEGTGISEEDAVKTLNTELLAGNGPDILLLDRMNIDGYVKKELLVDLSEELNKATEQGELFETVSNTYSDNGAVYAIPMGFAVQIAQGKEELLRTIEDMPTFMEQIKVIKKESDIPIFTQNDFEWAAEYFYYGSIAADAESGNCSKKQLKSFFEQMKTVYKTMDHPALNNLTLTQGKLLPTLDVYGVMEKNCLISLEYTSLPGIQFQKYEAGNLLNIGLTYKIFEPSGKKQYFPMNIVGINANSKQQDLAKEFISLLLSNETRGNTNGYISVSKDGMKKELMEGVRERIELKTGVTIENQPMPEEQKNEIADWLETMEIPVSRDYARYKMFMDTLEKYVTGNTSLDKAADTLLQKYDLMKLETLTKE